MVNINCYLGTDIIVVVNSFIIAMCAMLLRLYNVDAHLFHCST